MSQDGFYDSIMTQLLSTCIHFRRYIFVCFGNVNASFPMPIKPFESREAHTHTHTHDRDRNRDIRERKRETERKAPFIQRSHNAAVKTTHRTGKR